MNYFRCSFIQGSSGSGSSLIVTCDSEFSGATIVCTKGTTTYRKVCPATSPYEVSFDNLELGIWTISSTVNGKTYSATIEITDFEAYLVYGFNWQRWVTLGGLDPTDYSDLDDVFDDEAAVRRLMTVHASADYFIAKVSDDVDEIDAFCANDTAMKWIGLRDYVCDGLTAISGVWTKFLASDYWERILKDHVPTMKSNTTPYGTVSASSAASANPAYYAFNNDLSNAWVTNASVTSSSIVYAFNNPTEVRKAAVRNAKASGSTTFTYKVQYSDEGTTGTWTDILETATVIPNSTTRYIDVPSVGYHRYWRIAIVSSASTTHTSSFIQFYGRTLNVSVPVMTSNTAPYGEAIGTEERSGYPLWQAYDGDDTTQGDPQSSGTTTECYMGYIFPKKMAVKKVVFLPSWNANTINTISLQGSNTGNNNDWTDIKTGITSTGTTTGTKIIEASDNNDEYKYYRLLRTAASTGNVFGFYTLQFYGVDYTEREFAEGSTVKYLYDHGLELEPIELYTYGGGTATKYDDYIKVTNTSTQSTLAAAYAVNIDLTEKTYYRAVIGDYFNVADSSGAPAQITIWDRVPNVNVEGRMAMDNAKMSSIDLPANAYCLPIESLTGSYIVAFNAMTSATSSSKTARNADVKELWLE